MAVGTQMLVMFAMLVMRRTSARPAARVPPERRGHRSGLLAICSDGVARCSRIRARRLGGHCHAGGAFFPMRPLSLSIALRIDDVFLIPAPATSCGHARRRSNQGRREESGLCRECPEIAHQRTTWKFVCPGTSTGPSTLLHDRERSGDGGLDPALDRVLLSPTVSATRS